MSSITIPVEELDVVFISYDEPYKELFWSELQIIMPFAKRVDGVLGFDNAHKEAATIADTKRFITIDGDTKVDHKFFDMNLVFDDQYKNHIFSWAGTNVVNGLVYGNGSIKCWVRDAVFKMKTHENAASDQNRIEFCWGLPYLSMRDSYSTTFPAPTPFHAFRAGFREGVKMGVDQGKRVDPKKLFQTIWPGNAQKLMTWASVGADHDNGLWCIYGARLGLSMLNDPSWDYHQVADYQWFDEFWDEVSLKDQFSANDETGFSSENRLCNASGFSWNVDVLEMVIVELGDLLYEQTGVDIPLMSTRDSKFVKSLLRYKEPPTEQVLFYRSE